MKPFYASALLFVMVCSLWVANDTPYTPHHALAQSHYNVSFGSIGTLHH